MSRLDASIARCAAATDSNSVLLGMLADAHRLTGCLHQMAENAHDHNNDGDAVMQRSRGMLLRMSANHESYILRQHGAFEVVYLDEQRAHSDMDTDADADANEPVREVIIRSPPCANGADCVGMSKCIIGFTGDVDGVVLMAFIHEHELKTLRETARVPDNWDRRGCVLCCRRSVGNAVYACSTQGIACPAKMIIQPWHNPAGRDGSYSLGFVHSPCSYDSVVRDGSCITSNGMCSTFAVFNADALVAMEPGSTSSVWTIDQSAMIQRPAIA